MEGSDSEEASSSDSDPEDDEYSIFGDLSDETGSDASDASDVDVLEAEVVEALQHLQDAHHRKDKPEMTPYQQHILTYYVLCQKAQFSRNTLENELLPQVNRTFVLLEPNSKEKRFTKYATHSRPRQALLACRQPLVHNAMIFLLVSWRFLLATLTELCRFLS